MFFIERYSQEFLSGFFATPCKRFVKVRLSLKTLISRKFCNFQDLTWPMEEYQLLKRDR